MIPLNIIDACFSQARYHSGHPVSSTKPLAGISSTEPQLDKVTH